MNPWYGVNASGDHFSDVGILERLTESIYLSYLDLLHQAGITCMKDWPKNYAPDTSTNSAPKHYEPVTGRISF